MKKYKIMSITNGYDNNIGEIIIVKANPVKTNRNLGCETVDNIIGPETEMFHLPHKEQFFNPIIRIAQRDDYWCPEESEFNDCNMLEEESKRMINVHRHISFNKLTSNQSNSIESMKFYSVQMNFHNDNPVKIRDVWEISTSSLNSNYGKLEYISVKIISPGIPFFAVEIKTTGSLNFKNLPNGEDKEISIPSVQLMYHPRHNLSLIYIMKDNTQNYEALFMGKMEESDGLKKLFNNVRKKEYNYN